eukprot:5219969-Pleurochrysis_carterae.AAC.6
MAATSVENDAAGASGEQLRRAAALTGLANEQDAMAPVYPTRAMVSAATETDAMAGSCMLNARRTLRAMGAEAYLKPDEEKEMKTVRGNMQH